MADDGSDPQNREDLKAWGIESDDGTLSEVVYKKEQDNRGLKEESAPDEGGRRGAPVSFPGVASLDRRKACSEKPLPEVPKEKGTEVSNQDLDKIPDDASEGVTKKEMKTGLGKNGVIDPEDVLEECLCVAESRMDTIKKNYPLSDEEAALIATYDRKAQTGKEFVGIVLEDIKKYVDNAILCENLCDVLVSMIHESRK